MTEEEKVKALEARLHDIELWQAGHGAKETERWLQQEKHNQRLDKCIEEHRIMFDYLSRRMTKMEVRLGIYISIIVIGSHYLLDILLKGCLT